MYHILLCTTSAVCGLTHLIVTSPLKDMDYWWLCFTDEELEAPASESLAHRRPRQSLREPGTLLLIWVALNRSGGVLGGLALWGVQPPALRESARQGPTCAAASLFTPARGRGGGHVAVFTSEPARAVPAPALPLIGRPGNLARARPRVRACARAAARPLGAGPTARRSGAPCRSPCVPAQPAARRPSLNGRALLSCLNPGGSHSVIYARHDLWLPTLRRAADDRLFRRGEGIREGTARGSRRNTSWTPAWSWPTRRRRRETERRGIGREVRNPSGFCCSPARPTSTCGSHARSSRPAGPTWRVTAIDGSSSCRSHRPRTSCRRPASGSLPSNPPKRRQRQTWARGPLLGHPRSPQVK
ncbi:chromobox protein homolog 7 isoform X5 [Bos indicus]|uniref:Chromobox protein homolog 7 isoform X5 n=1 Tax=Bos indicus TaxID=9915 RepID=A0ABM4SFG0_BOSIN